MPALLTTACASKVMHGDNFTGDVTVRSLMVEFEDIDVVESGNGGLIDNIKRLQKLAQEVSDFTNIEKSEALSQQLVKFQTVLIDRIRLRSGLPLKISPDSAPKLVYGPSSELTEIQFTYPPTKGAVVDLFARVSYPSQTVLSATALEDSIGTRRLKVKPRIDLRIKGKNKVGEKFWNDSIGYTSDISYTIANDYVLGLSQDRINDADIFLIPLAQGL